MPGQVALGRIVSLSARSWKSAFDSRVDILVHLQGYTLLGRGEAKRWVQAKSNFGVTHFTICDWKLCHEDQLNFEFNCRKFCILKLKRKVLKIPIIEMFPVQFSPYIVHMHNKKLTKWFSLLITCRQLKYPAHLKSSLRE